MRILLPLVMSLLALPLSVGLIGCDQKKDEPLGNQNEEQSFVQNIAASKGSEETQTFTGTIRGIEIKLAYYYKGDIVLRQSSENKIIYSRMGAQNKEEAQKMLQQISEAYQKIQGITERIDYQDSYAVEYVTIDYTKASIKELCKLPGTSITDCSAQYISMIRSQKLLKGNGFQKIN